MAVITNTCALYGGQTYVNNWLPINLLIVLISLLVVAAIFSISSIMDGRTRERLRGAARSELTQAILSVVIIVILLGLATTVCKISASLSSSYTGKAMNPFTYATYYIGNLSVNTGINLLSNIYATSVQYSIDGVVFSNIGNLLNAEAITKPLWAKFKAIFGISVPLSVTISASTGIGTTFETLSELYIAILSPIVTVAVGLLFVQYIALSILEYTAFVVILPIAIALRSVSFLGSNLRFAANAVLAIAIAAYIIYPTTIAFNSYAISWIYSNNNPSYKLGYLQPYTVPQITPFSFFRQTAPQPNNVFSNGYDILWPFVNSAYGSTSFFGTVKNILSLPFTVVQQNVAIINQSAQFLFASIVMVLMDVSITIGFAMGLTRALNAGVEGTGSFWGGL